MARFVFSMESDDLHEVVHFLNTASKTSTGHVAEDVVEPQPEVENPPAPKPTRARSKKVEEATAGPAPEEAKAADAAEPATEEKPAPSDDEHPMLKVPTLNEIKEKANAIIITDPTKGPKLVAGLKERFGVSAFGGVNADDYPRCWAMLEELEG